MIVEPIPTGFHTITPYFTVPDAGRFINFLKEAFEAKEIDCCRHEGRIINAVIQIGTSMVMVGEKPDAPQTGTTMYLYVPDTDAVYHRALKAGATSIMEPDDKFYGDRNAGVQDFLGNNWWIATHIEDVSPEEMEKRTQAFFAK